MDPQLVQLQIDSAKAQLAATIAQRALQDYQSQKQISALQDQLTKVQATKSVS